jgi:hypothetical protein
MKALRESRGIALLGFYISALKGWGVSVTPRPLTTPGKHPLTVVQEAGWAPLTDAENIAPTGIRSPDRPARSQPLYRLSYPVHCFFYKIRIIEIFNVMLEIVMKFHEYPLCGSKFMLQQHTQTEAILTLTRDAVARRTFLYPCQETYPEQPVLNT